MIKIEHTEVAGWQAAIRGMRNAHESWAESDSVFSPVVIVGDNDIKLMKKLSKAGDDHGKFERFIDVWCDITAPLYFWREFETYRAGVCPFPMDIEINSCSTMHCITKNPITTENFSCEHLTPMGMKQLEGTINSLEAYRLGIDILKKSDDYNKEAEKMLWWHIIQQLPNGYNQKRTVKMTYQALKHMYFARKYHPQDEWREFCKWCLDLPYFMEVCVNE